MEESYLSNIKIRSLKFKRQIALKVRVAFEFKIFSQSHAEIIKNKKY